MLNEHAGDDEMQGIPRPSPSSRAVDP
jgi:hypothetical protein